MPIPHSAPAGESSSTKRIRAPFDRVFVKSPMHTVRYVHKSYRFRYVWVGYGRLEFTQHVRAQPKRSCPATQIGG